MPRSCFKRAVVLLALLTLPPGRLAADSPKIKKSDCNFDSGRKSIKVECFEPVSDEKKPARYPAIVLLHDSEGLGSPMPGPFYRFCCRLLAKEGYVVLLVHYFDRTGHERVTPKEVTRDLFLAWRTTIRDAVKFAGKQKQVDAGRIGLLGFSLGAFLSLSVAAEQDLKIAAVGEFFGGLHEEQRKDVRSFPPTLIVHGDKDKVVPVENAYKLKKLLDAKKLTCQMKIYAGQEHMFRGESLTGQVLSDVQRCTILFFASHLKKSAGKMDMK
jgi:dienelactone hydrolase